ncbi:allophanate hydrolase [Pseudidiomarina aestuarii]|uniref:Allophanate hydrolase n=1 Tax=Pseudidiomarina aestuarii TaxID=624146 RepID=A0A7Z6ZT56_9GAMM|nr:biotin-dependent carboxyltransferase family protein [Pseudidiomarina aestuarii]RUO40865.1 allophanate hydrolase [Pseudidiomarina aestuarii]
MAKISPVLEIKQPGLLATLQDRGRSGYLAAGITSGGAVDEYAFLWANKLLDNPADAAQIEVTLGGFEANLLRRTQMVICGAPMQVALNGRRLPTWLVFDVEPGDVLTIAAAPRGVRSYLAVRGGFRAEAVLGSMATVKRDQLGGLRGDGSALTAGDVLTAPVLSAPALLPRRPRTDLLQTQPANEPLTIDVIAAGQYERFSQQAREQFCSQTYQVTAAQDRMGMRLQGPKSLSWEHDQILSEPLPVGAIQIPPDGQPIIMLVDRQTLGGYPKIGTVTWRSRCLLGQATAGTELVFNRVSLAAAQNEWRQFQRFFGSA